VQVEQDVHGNLAEDPVVLGMQPRLLGIVGEHVRFHVAPYVARAEDHLLYPQHRHGKWHVKFHAQRRRGQHQSADRRREIVHPGGHHHGTHAVRDEDHVVDRNAMG